MSRTSDEETAMPEEQNRRLPTAPDNPPLSRRTFLRGALTGTALVGAGALSACAPTMPPGGAVQPSPAAGARPARKVSKAFARYQDRPNRGQRCADCVHFLPSGACRVVAGPISRNGWSRYFELA
jgi:hypothetical protein